MSAATSLTRLHDAWQSAIKTLPVPSSGAVIDQEGKAFAVVDVPAGTYQLPDGGTPLFVRATGAVTLTTELAVTVATLEASSVAFCIPLTSTTWMAIVGEVGASPAVIGLPNAQYNTSSTVTAETPAAGKLTGARHVFYENTADGAKEITTRTGAQLYADLSGAGITDSWLLTIVNRGNNTVTLTGGEDVTVNGEATIATLTTRTYVCRYNGSSAVIMQAVNKGTIET